MRNSTKLLLIIATSLVLIGCILFIGGMSMLKWNFKALSTNKYRTNVYEINEEFNNVFIETRTADITFALSDNEKCKVECYEEEKAMHSVRVENKTLSIKVNNEKKFYDYIGINIGTPKITVYLPQAEYASLTIKGNTGSVQVQKDFSFKDADISLSTGDVDFYASASDSLKIKTSTGSIYIKDTSVISLDASASTGKINIERVKSDKDISVKVTTGKVYILNTECKNFSSSGDTGDIFLEHVIVTEKLSIERDTGDVIFDFCDANEIVIITDTGDVKGSLLSDKIFLTKTDTGRVNVPNTVNGGKCQISTDTGNIKISIKQP